MNGTLPKKRWRLDPTTARRIRRFKEIRRGYYSFWILVGLVAAAVFAPLFMGNRALAVQYKGSWTFPILSGFHAAESFGMAGTQECDYRLLRAKLRKEGSGRVWLPLVPYNGVEVNETVVRVFPSGPDSTWMHPLRKTPEPILESKIFAWHENGRRSHVVSIRNGKPEGSVSYRDPLGHVVARGRFENGVFSGWKAAAGAGNELPAGLQPLPAEEAFYHQVPFPSAPGVGGHLLGTDESGRDICARLFYGFRIVILASFIFLLMSYLIAISIGCAMGYFGGWFDLFFQRIIEIWSEIPFLYMVIILAAIFTPNLFMLLVIMVAFSWMGLANFMRTATYREKTRDYVASAKLLGASTRRILFRHILPNTLSLVITFVPFTISGVIVGLTSLDFLGFGLPPTEPTWGSLLQSGTSATNIRSAPWILSSVFGAMVAVLMLITFVGEAVREAFDPRKFTVYK